ncbi:MAG: NAD(P)/FAD-dependent oxidoreductase, partial [Candidatus Thorarchaeota archaeon]|nr:NAD(P)/FAD-dependent oxidoreductase [Candidatus Thorarchaeota archaeon]
LSLSPEDEKEIRDFIKEVDWMKNSPLLTDLGMSTAPPELKGRFSSLREMWEMRSFMKYFTGKFSKKAATYAKRFHSPILQSVLTYSFSPDSPIWFVIMILATVAAGHLGLLTKGCPDFVESIAERYKSLGGEIQYRSTVEKIIVEDDKAVGVQLSDGTEYRADVVVSAADGQSTIFEMLDGKYVDEKIVRRYESWKPFDPTVIISYGMNRTFDDAPPFLGFFLKEPLRVGNRAVDCLPLRVLNYGDAFAPEGKTVIQVMLETDWDYWNDLRQNHDAYKLEKEQLAQEVLERLETYYPGLSSQVEMTDIASPYTTWRYTRNHKGSPMGWLITTSTLTEQIRRTLPGLSNFYMAGQWVLPGGGVPGCIYTGRNVIQILCREDNREFGTKWT